MTLRIRLFALILLAFPMMSARADQHAAPPTEISGGSANGRFHVYARLETGDHHWSALLVDSKTLEVTRGTLGQQSRDPHFSLLVTDDGSRVVLIDPSAGDRDDHRVQIFDREFHRLEEFGFDVLLNDEERAGLGRTVSHVGLFLSPDPVKHQNWWIDEADGSFALHLQSGRTVRIALKDARLIDR